MEDSNEFTCKHLEEWFWRGEFDDVPEPFEHPMKIMGRYLPLENYQEGVGFVYTLANVTLFDTLEGIVLVDCGTPLGGKFVLDEIKKWKPGKPVHTCVYTHGHLDHCMGIDIIEQDQLESGFPKVRVVAHENVPQRFARYRLTNHYNRHINVRQFQIEAEWPTEFRMPDHVYNGNLTLEIGGIQFFLFHDKGETDDSTWVWVPQKKSICAGDLFIWATPNCGNPQKVQRYPLEWSMALKKMLALDAEFLFPGHGPPIVGRDRVKQALSDTIKFLDSICDQTLTGINKGMSLNDIIHSLELDQTLLQKPYLRPIYDDPKFIVSNIWRRYCGWWDFNVAHLRPVKDSVLAKEVVNLSGGIDQLVQRAFELKSTNLDLSVQLIEFALRSNPEERKVQETAAEIFKEKVKEEKNTMAIGIYTSAMNDCLRKAKELREKSNL